MKKQIPFPRQSVDEIAEELGIDIARASIREMNGLVNVLEERFGARFIRMEFGIPGLPASRIAVEAESEALLRDGVANSYAPFDGIPELKQAGSVFVKAFLDLEFPPESIIPTNGAMQGCFVAQGLAGTHRPGKDTILYLDPGFPVNKLQTRLLGLKSVSLDLHEFRGAALAEKVDEICAAHGVGGCLWSSPNNPAWVALDEEELRGLAEVLTRHEVFAIEDLAYFGMDFRTDYSVPFQPPFQPTIARYMDRVFLIISSSKLFSYAGQRCGLCAIPPKFAGARFPKLAERFSKERVLDAFIQGGLYPTTASVAHGPQRGLAALLKATVEGIYNPWQEVREYGRRAAFMKKAFTDNGFYLVYDRDRDLPLADGFYFTFAYPGMSGARLAREMVYYGISAITLDVTGSTHTEGLRACVSLTTSDQFEDLVHRLNRFRKDHPL